MKIKALVFALMVLPMALATAQDKEGSGPAQSPGPDPAPKEKAGPIPENLKAMAKQFGVPEERLQEMWDQTGGDPAKLKEMLAGGQIGEVLKGLLGNGKAGEEGGDKATDPNDPMARLRKALEGALGGQGGDQGGNAQNPLERLRDLFGGKQADPSAKAAPAPETTKAQEQDVAFKVPEVVVKSGTAVRVDGRFSPGEWDDAAKFKVKTSGGEGWARIKTHGARLYVGLDLKAEVRSRNQIHLFIDTKGDAAKRPAVDDADLIYTPKNNWQPILQELKGAGSAWDKAKPVGRSGIPEGAYPQLVKDAESWTAIKGWEAKGFSDSSTGVWTVEYRVDFEKLGITPGEAKTIGLAVVVREKRSSVSVPAVTTPDVDPFGFLELNPNRWARVSSSDNWKAQ